jgi:3'-phosphoadenosine 5'-phosphosulfate sulfotransferase (PAPS reductase)/FAD synthetase
MHSRVTHITSVSGGKDSTALILQGIEQGIESRYVTADTGHEHELTYEYLDYLEQKLGITIERYKADFTDDMKKKRQRLIDHLLGLDNGKGYGRRLKQYTGPMLQRMIDNMKSTGNPFLDLCILKGRFPSSQARFCTEELKSNVIDMQVMLPLASQVGFDRSKIWSWQGVRRQESSSRAGLSHFDLDEFSTVYRPILGWTHEDVFDMHKRHGVKPNPLYKMGFGRVGCMPCIMANKEEMTNIYQRAPQHIDRVEQWEEIVAMSSKRGKGTLIPTTNVPGWPKELNRINIAEHGIRSYATEYAMKSRGGRQSDWITEQSDTTTCSSKYGLCE